MLDTRPQICSMPLVGRWKAGLVLQHPRRGYRPNRIVCAESISQNRLRSLRTLPRTRDLMLSFTALVREAAESSPTDKSICVALAICWVVLLEKTCSLRAAPAFMRSVMARGLPKRARLSPHARRVESFLKRKRWCSTGAVWSRGSPESTDRDGRGC